MANDYNNTDWTEDANTKASASSNIEGATQLNNTLTIGVNDTGYDVKFFGDTATNGYMLWDASTDDLILGSSSKIGIGEASPDNSLHVTVANGNDNTYVAKFENADADNPNGILISHSGGDFSEDDTSDHTAIQYSDSNSGVFSVFGDGDVVNEDNSYTSDIRIKTNVVDATAKLDELLKLKVRNFHYKDSDGKTVGKKRLGFIADELETVFPSLIKKRKIKKFGVEFDDLKTITGSVLVPVLVKAIQELSAKVTALENA
tara:strand:+ start:1296 stop:2075 length:780 start_codon:yes stop_codon:yes gene_type:complete